MLKSKNNIVPEDRFAAVNRAFTTQSVYYDEEDKVNVILNDWRRRVYAHVRKYLKPHSRIFELNAGTGIDAMYFVNQGHQVHATDLSDGMIREIKYKIELNILQGMLTAQQCSFDQLDQVDQKGFDYIFSNFGGLNCIEDLSNVTRYFSKLLKFGGYVTLVIMPPICPWEWLWALRGKWAQAFRRLKKSGTVAHLEGEYFKTWYHSQADVKKAMGPSYRLIKCETLGLISAPPGSLRLSRKYSFITSLLGRIESLIKGAYPFNRWGDHIIVTFKYTG